MPDDHHDRPEWHPDAAGDAYAGRVSKGVPGPEQVNRQRKRKRRAALTTDDYVAGLRAGDRTILARAITLIESDAPAHREQAQEVLHAVLPQAGKSLRVGITGTPGAGKSTFIEALGVKLCGEGQKVAVLAVDPSSSVTRGSILGDKTRMEKLSQEPNAFIRPSPSSGTLGGVTRKSRETLLLCEAFGFDVVLVETVGVGQSEVTVRSMVDVFLLLMIAGGGDDLQGIKKGVIELADLIAVNKADHDNVQRAKMAAAEMNRVLHYLHPATEGWRSRALTCSALTGDGIDTLWSEVQRYRENVTKSGVFERRRADQSRAWLRALIDDTLRARFFDDPAVQAQLPGLEAGVVQGELTAVEALNRLFK